MKMSYNKDQNQGNKVSEDLASNSKLSIGDFSFEQRLMTDILFGGGKARRHIDMVKLGLCFMSLEEALAAIPQTKHKVLTSEGFVVKPIKTDETWRMFKLAFFTFHSRNQGIPEMWIELYKPELTGEQELVKIENIKSRAGVKKSWIQKITCKDGSVKEIEHFYK